MRVLVSGGAGYIGSHTVLQLIGAGHDPVIVDDFSNSDRAVVGRLAMLAGREIAVHEVNLTNRLQTLDLMVSGHFDAVIHFAGHKAVGESVAQPLGYYDNNLRSTLSLLTAMRDVGPRRMVFSSSATVYGPDATSPLREGLPLSATSPYGWSKVMIERILRDVATADDSWRIGVLRYFNPVGAHPSGLIGEHPRDVPNNLMPYLALVAAGRANRLRIFGDDYATPDGTGVRDYIHVEDLAAGHLAVLERLGRMSAPVDTWNLGTGRGTSVLALVRAFGRAVGRDLSYDTVGRRPGDVAISYADPSKAYSELGWEARRTIEQMCADTWRWQQANQTGYGAETAECSSLDDDG